MVTEELRGKKMRFNYQTFASTLDDNQQQQLSLIKLDMMRKVFFFVSWATTDGGFETCGKVPLER